MPGKAKGAKGKEPGAKAAQAKKKGRKEIEKKNQVLERLKVEYVPVNTIKPNSYNPNRQSEHDFYLLLKSMYEDGFTQPIICLKNTREVVDGEHRWTASIVLNELNKRGLDEEEWQPQLIEELRRDRLKYLDPELSITVVFVDMTPEQMRISTLRHNRARGSEDLELTAQLMRDLQKLGALDWAQDSLMMDDVEINRMLEDIKAPDSLANEEFGDSWVPEMVGDPDKVAIERNTTEAIAQDKGGNFVAAMSQAAIDAAREREKRIAEAKTEEEKQAALKESNLYRVSLTFAGDEAGIVKSVLGNKPAVTLLEMCKAKLEAGKAQAGG